MFARLSAAVECEDCKFEALKQSIYFIGYFYSAINCVSFMAHCLFQTLNKCSKFNKAPNSSAVIVYRYSTYTINCVMLHKHIRNTNSMEYLHF